MINWNASKTESRLIDNIAKRAFFKGWRANQTQTMMDITACHLNGCELDLEGLLAAPSIDFAHDVCGISRHIDRETGQLKDLFEPRYAFKSSEVSR